MPLYEYECPQCGQVFEAITLNKEIDHFCPYCSVSMRRLMSSPAYTKVLGYNAKNGYSAWSD